LPLTLTESLQQTRCHTRKAQVVAVPPRFGTSIAKIFAMNTKARAGRRRLLVVGALATLAAACSTMQVGSDFDKGAEFSGYHSFTIMQREHRGTHNPLVATRTEDAIRQQLQQQGYVQAADPLAADFTVDFTIGSQERTDIDSYPGMYAGGGWGWGRRGWWGGPYWGPDVDVRQYREGTLSIDMFDAHSHRPVWHGWAKKELTQKDIDQSEQPIQRAVAAVLARFPPGRAPANQH
jgi:hypothetical protein